MGGCSLCGMTLPGWLSWWLAPGSPHLAEVGQSRIHDSVVRMRGRSLRSGCAICLGKAPLRSTHSATQAGLSTLPCSGAACPGQTPGNVMQM